MKTNALLLAVISVLIPSISTSVAQRSPLPSADMRIDTHGYHYIEVTNKTDATYSITIAYTMKFADGERRPQKVTWIIDPGKTETAFKCAMRSPDEQISDVKVLNLRKM